MTEKIIAVIVGLGFFLIGVATLIWPAKVRRLRTRYNERFAFFYSKDTLWDGRDGFVHFLYRVGGAVIAAIGFIILYGTLSQ